MRFIRNNKISETSLYGILSLLVLSVCPAFLFAEATYSGKIVSQFSPSEFAVVLTPEFPPPQTTPVTFKISQKMKRFNPPFIVIPKGSQVNFLNDDNVQHNAWSESKIRRFDVGLLEEGEEPVIPFPRVGKVEIFCNIHAKMYALVWVVETPFYAIPDKDYQFSIPGLPEGSYQIEVVHYLLKTTPHRGKLIVKGNTVEGPAIFDFSKEVHKKIIRQKKKKVKIEEDF